MKKELLKNKSNPLTRPSATLSLLGRGKQRAFTLIELLVVVLIIGILAAVAVPQYQKSVDRARATETVQLISALQKAADVWLLANSNVEYAELLTEDSSYSLDIDVPCQYNEQGFCAVNNDEIHVIFGNGIWGSDGDALVYSLHAYASGSTDYVCIAAMHENKNWQHKCGYFNDRGKAICDGLQNYETEENFEI